MEVPESKMEAFRQYVMQMLLAAPEHYFGVPSVSIQPVGPDVVWGIYPVQQYALSVDVGQGATLFLPDGLFTDVQADANLGGGGSLLLRGAHPAA